MHTDCTAGHFFGPGTPLKVLYSQCTCCSASTPTPLRLVQSSPVHGSLHTSPHLTDVVHFTLVCFATSTRSRSLHFSSFSFFPKLPRDALTSSDYPSFTSPFSILPPLIVELRYCFPLYICLGLVFACISSISPPPPRLVSFNPPQPQPPPPTTNSSVLPRNDPLVNSK